MKRMECLFRLSCISLAFKTSTSFSPFFIQRSFIEKLPPHQHDLQSQRKELCDPDKSAGDNVVANNWKPSHNVTTVHLVSLSSLNTSSPQILRDIWRWKDMALGDGRDYFIPRPRAISDFQSLFLRNDYASTGQCEDPSGHVDITVEECAILSNCARLDIYLLLRTLSKNSIDRVPSRGFVIETSDLSFDWIEEEAKKITAQVLTNQLKAYKAFKSERSPLSEGLSTLLDLPGVIQMESQASHRRGKISTSENPISQSTVNELTSSLTIVSGADNVTRHACLVAAGMKDRPSRPGREVPFRPFSSRDAHVMLQMKRTVDVSKGNTINSILRAALQAGKAARDPNKVPEIIPLKGYNNGEGGRYSKPNAPSKLVRKATKAAVDSAIEPVIQKCVSNFYAMQSSRAISNLRLNAQSLIAKSENTTWDSKKQSPTFKEKTKRINQILHEPTMNLREGKEIDEQKILILIKEELGYIEEFRHDYE